MPREPLQPVAVPRPDVPYRRPLSVTRHPLSIADPNISPVRHSILLENNPKVNDQLLRDANPWMDDVPDTFELERDRKHPTPFDKLADIIIVRIWYTYAEVPNIYQDRFIPQALRDSRSLIRRIVRHSGPEESWARRKCAFNTLRGLARAIGLCGAKSVQRALMESEVLGSIGESMLVLAKGFKKGEKSTLRTNGSADMLEEIVCMMGRHRAIFEAVLDELEPLAVRPDAIPPRGRPRNSGIPMFSEGYNQSAQSINKRTNKMLNNPLPPPPTEEALTSVPSPAASSPPGSPCAYDSDYSGRTTDTREVDSVSDYSSFRKTDIFRHLIGRARHTCLDIPSFWPQAKRFGSVDQLDDRLKEIVEKVARLSNQNSRYRTKRDALAVLQCTWRYAYTYTRDGQSTWIWHDGEMYVRLFAVMYRILWEMTDEERERLKGQDDLLHRGLCMVVWRSAISQYHGDLFELKEILGSRKSPWDSESDSDSAGDEAEMEQDDEEIMNATGGRDEGVVYP